MHCPKHVAAFTLIELLIVLAITSTLLVASAGFGFQARQTFTAEEYVKTLIIQSRSARRKSMLITRSSEDSSWVFGIGIQILKRGQNWELTQIKALEKTNKSYFYQSYPKSIDEMDVLVLDAANKQTLPTGINIQLTIPNGQTATEKNCVATMTELRVIFESINGKLHAYCFSPSIGGYIQLTNTTVVNATPDLSLAITYENGGSYKYKVNLGSNGDISTNIH